MSKESATVRIWKPSEKLPPRIKKLRDEYFSFYDRDYFRNEVRAYTTGMPGDPVWSPHNWGVVPELFPFMKGMFDALRALAEEVKVPDDFWKHTIAYRRGLFFKIVLEKYLPVKILEQELIVGSYFNTALSKVLRPDEQKEWYKREFRWYKKLEFLNDVGIGNTGAIPGHIIPNYPKVLKMGMKGIVEYIESEIEKETDKEKIEFLQSMILSLESAKMLSERYSWEARKLAQEEKDPQRKEELEEIARITAKVPWEPAETFWEALQSIWITHMLVMAAESYPGAGLSHGRFDQYMYPYYKKDIEEGRITKEFARELLMAYWIKHNYVYDYQGRVGQNQGINSGFGQLMTLSGKGPNGEDMTNELTWLIFDVIEDMNLLEPKPNIRVHKNTPEPVLKRITSMVTKTQGSPFLINFDEQAIKGLLWQGMPEEEVWDYAPVGCLENTFQGKDRSGTVDVNINLLKAIELTLFNGRDIRTGKRIGLKTGDPRKFKTFEEFKQAFVKQLKYIIDKLLELAMEADAIRAKFEPIPYLSAIVDGCIEKRKDVTAGGPVYNFITVEGIGLANTADSLTAAKKLVFEEKKISMDELLYHIQNNFEGREGEKIRQILINKAPKYGNDNDEADAMARFVSQLWTKYVFTKKSPTTGRRFRGGYLSWNYWIAYAPAVSATPDGRRRGTFLANAIGPIDGMAKKGPTAEALSVGKLGLETAPNGDSHTMNFSPAMLRDEEHVEKMANFLRTYNEKGGTALQINIIDADTLREAQKHPEDYQNLLVRITGYNAYFVMLGKEMQDEIIARESHKL